MTCYLKVLHSVKVKLRAATLKHPSEAFSFQDISPKMKQHLLVVLMSLSVTWFRVTINLRAAERETLFRCTRKQQQKHHTHGLIFPLLACSSALLCSVPAPSLCRLVANSSKRSFINWQQQRRSFSQRPFNCWRNACGPKNIGPQQNRQTNVLRSGGDPTGHV